MPQKSSHLDSFFRWKKKKKMVVYDLSFFFPFFTVQNIVILDFKGFNLKGWPKLKFVLRLLISFNCIPN